jgi:hypothetical protein
MQHCGTVVFNESELSHDVQLPERPLAVESILLYSFSSHALL